MSRLKISGSLQLQAWEEDWVHGEGGRVRRGGMGWVWGCTAAGKGGGLAAAVLNWQSGVTGFYKDET